MILAASESYPFLEVFWTMLVFFAFVIWIWILFTVFADLFRRHDTSGGVKVLWIIFIVIVPYFGAFVYLIAEHKGMTERSIAAQQERRVVSCAGISKQPRGAVKLRVKKSDEPVGGHIPA